MGLGAGHTLDMIKRLNQNRKQKASQKPKFKNKNGRHTSKSSKTKLNFKKSI